MWLGSLFRTRVPAKQLADVLFEHFVLADEISWREKHLARYSKDAVAEALTKQVFIYLAASTAVALTNEASRQPNVRSAAKRFRKHVTTEALRRWAAVEGDADRAVEEAAGDLARLFFTDPRQQASFSLDWARDWLAAAGAEETNPVSLFLISSLWKKQYVQLAKMLRHFRIMS